MAEKTGDVPEPVVERLKVLYGSEYRDVLELARDRPDLDECLPGSRTIGAQVVYAIRNEMAHHLDDIVMRRTELGSAGHPGNDALRVAAAIAARELDWDEQRTSDEVSRVAICFPSFA